MSKQEIAAALEEMVARLRGWQDVNSNPTDTEKAIADAFEALAEVILETK